MPYSWLTLAQALMALGQRLDDPSAIHFTHDEKVLYIQDALRTWNAYTRYWRDSFSFNARALESPANAFYDLTGQSGSLIPFTLEDTDLESLLCYNLIESQPSAGVWTGTDQFSIYDLTQALQRRRDQFLVETGMVATRQLIGGITPPSSSVALPDTVIDARRGAWFDGLTGAWSALWKSDEYRAQALSFNWATSPAIPTGFSVAATPPVSLRLIPPPLNPGELELISVNAGAALNPAAGVPLGIPDDFAWVVRFGALADLLGADGQARDPARAQYAESRWQEGIIAARAYTSVELGYINGSQVPVSSLFDLDTIEPGWQNSPGSPSTLALAAWNLLALSPVPDDAAPYSVSVDLVRNAPIPSADGDLIQLGREELDCVLEYCIHLACFKEGGAEFQATMKHYANFRRMALVRNERLAAAIRSAAQPLFDKGWREERQRPRRASELPVGISLSEEDEGG